MTKKYEPMQLISALVAIPFLLAVPPIVGWFIGKWLDQWLDTSPFLMYVFLLLGFATGFLECYRLIKEFGDGP